MADRVFTLHHGEGDPESLGSALDAARENLGHLATLLPPGDPLRDAAVALAAALGLRRASTG